MPEAAGRAADRALLRLPTRRRNEKADPEVGFRSLQVVEPQR